VDKLRLTLLIIGLVIIAGIYLWGTVMNGPRPPRNRRILPQPKRPEYGEEAAGELPEIEPQSAGEEEERFIDQALTDLNQLVRESRSRTEIDGPVQLDVFVDSSSANGSSEPEPADEPADASSDPSQYRDVIALFVVAPEGSAFAGAGLRESFANIGVRYGDMSIFHHFGSGKLASREPIFSIASMLEPGTFDLAELDDAAVRGIVLFMRIPGPVDGRVGFELMLSTAERLKLELGGEIQDEHHRKLTLRQTERLRERASSFTAQ
jgi:cell division protein ZipA